jgi:chromate transporter
LVIITLIAAFLSNFADIPMVRHAFGGIRVAVGALILDTIVKLVRGFYRDFKALIIAGLALAFSVVFSASPVLLVLAAGVAGFLIYRPRPLKDGKGGSDGQGRGSPESGSGGT